MALTQPQLLAAVADRPSGSNGTETYAKCGHQARVAGAPVSFLEFVVSSARPGAGGARLPMLRERAARFGSWGWLGSLV
jgi:hypothetical protein